MRKWLTSWEGKDDELGIKGPPYRKLGVDAQWENCLVVVDADGNILETWKQWDKIFRRPHSVYISPYDLQKRVWVVDDNMQAIYIFSHDGKQLLQTIGTPEHEGADATHFNRPTYHRLAARRHLLRLRRLHRHARREVRQERQVRDRSGASRAIPPNEKRPGYMNNVHGVAVDPVNRHVFVNDRNNHRIQVFDENGKYLSEWTHRCGSVEPAPALHRPGSQRLDLRPQHEQDGASTTSRDICCTRGARWACFPGGLWGVHGMSVDSGRQPLRRRSGQRPRAEVQAAAGRESGVPGGQAGQAGLDQRDELKRSDRSDRSSRSPQNDPNVPNDPNDPNVYFCGGVTETLMVRRLRYLTGLPSSVAG